MTLTGLNMTQLREVGYLLEEYVDSEVRGTSIDGLQVEIYTALLELDAPKLAEFLAAARAKGFDFDEPQPESEDPEAVEATEGNSDAEVQPEQSDDVVNATIIQIRCHPREHGLYNGDIIYAPKDFIVKRYPYAKLTAKEAKELHARGYRWNDDSRFTEEPKKRP